MPPSLLQNLRCPLPLAGEAIVIAHAPAEMRRGTVVVPAAEVPRSPMLPRLLRYLRCPLPLAGEALAIAHAPAEMRRGTPYVLSRHRMPRSVCPPSRARRGTVVVPAAEVPRSPMLPSATRHRCRACRRSAEESNAPRAECDEPPEWSLSRKIFVRSELTCPPPACDEPIERSLSRKFL